MVGCVAVMLAAMTLRADGPSACARELFRVARSTNANVVLYEANASGEGALSEGSLDPAEPVHPSWLMLAEDGRREDLTGLEWRLAYGIDVRQATAPDVASVALKADPQRSVAIRRQNGCLVAITPIDGREAILRVVFINVGRGLLPKVHSVELTGVDMETGAELRETIVARR